MLSEYEAEVSHVRDEYAARAPRSAFSDGVVDRCFAARSHALDPKPWRPISRSEARSKSPDPWHLEISRFAARVLTPGVCRYLEARGKEFVRSMLGAAAKRAEKGEREAEEERKRVEREVERVRAEGGARIVLLETKLEQAEKEVCASEPWITYIHT